MRLLSGLVLNVSGAVILGHLVGEFKMIYMIPMLMFCFAGIFIANSNKEVR